MEAGKPTPRDQVKQSAAHARRERDGVQRIFPNRDERIAVRTDVDTIRDR